MNFIIHSIKRLRFFVTDNVVRRFIVVHDKPSQKQRILMGAFLHSALVEIRRLGWRNQGVQAADLADAVENISTELFGTGVFQWSHLRTLLQNYQQKYPSVDWIDFVAELDQIRLSD